METSHLLLWFDSRQPRACELRDVPNALSYRGEVFHAETEYPGDVDYLRDQQDRLIGFAYISGGRREKVIWEALLSRSGNVRLDGEILIILLEDRPYEIQSVQAMGTAIYQSPSGDIMLAIPNWDFGELAFELATANTPSIIATR